jgi:hypothetical protein
MTTVNFSCAVAPNNADVPLGCEIWIDDTCLINTDHVNETLNVEHEFSEADGEHSLRITLKNKLSEHTQVDESGNIVSDALLTISNISFEGIDCSQIMKDLAVYRHNFNDTADQIDDQFFDCMGCNGTVELKFTMPLYLWLLENM